MPPQQRRTHAAASTQEEAYAEAQRIAQQHYETMSLLQGDAIRAAAQAEREALDNLRVDTMQAEARVKTLKEKAMMLSAENVSKLELNEAMEIRLNELSHELNHMTAIQMSQGAVQQQGEDDHAKRPSLGQLVEEVRRNDLFQDAEPCAAQATRLGITRRGLDLGLFSVFDFALASEVDLLLGGEGITRSDRRDENRPENHRQKHRRQVVGKGRSADQSQFRRVSDRCDADHHTEKDQWNHHQFQWPDEDDVAQIHPDGIHRGALGETQVKYLTQNHPGDEADENQHCDERVLLHGEEATPPGSGG